MPALSPLTIPPLLQPPPSLPLPPGPAARSLDSVQHPLRCGSWTAVAADLGDPSWADALLAAGFDPSRPTVWVAEGGWERGGVAAAPRRPVWVPPSSPGSLQRAFKMCRVSPSRARVLPANTWRPSPPRSRPADVFGGGAGPGHAGQDGRWAARAWGGGRGEMPCWPCHRLGWIWHAFGGVQPPRPVTARCISCTPLACLAALPHAATCPRPPHPQPCRPRAACLWGSA